MLLSRYCFCKFSEIDVRIVSILICGFFDDHSCARACLRECAKKNKKYASEIPKKSLPPVCSIGGDREFYAISARFDCSLVYRPQSASQEVFNFS